MSHHDDDTFVIDPADAQLTPSANGAAAGLSVLDRLKERRDKLAAPHVLNLDVAGTNGLLALRLGVLPRGKLAALSQRASRSTSPEADLNLNADTLIAACRAILARNTREEPWEPIVDDDDDPVRVDERMAGLLGLGTARARDVLTAMYGLAPSPDLAIAVAAGRYMEWAAAVDAEVDEEFQGESQAALTSG